MIDAHLHIGLNGWNSSKLIRYLDDQKIEKGWVLTWEELPPAVPYYYEHLNLEDLLNAFKLYPERIVPFYAPDPRRSDWKEAMERCLDLGFAGCAELKVPMRWDAPGMQPYLEFLEERKLPLIFHMEQGRTLFLPPNERRLKWFFRRAINERFNGRYAPALINFIERTRFYGSLTQEYLEEFEGYLMDFAALEQALHKYPNIQFIAHGPHFWNHFAIPKKSHLTHQTGNVSERGIIWDLLEKHPNLWCDVSGFSGHNALTRSKVHGKAFLNKFAHKILFGTDNSNLGMKELIEAEVEDSKKRASIFHNNAERLVN